MYPGFAVVPNFEHNVSYTRAPYSSSRYWGSGYTSCRIRVLDEVRIALHAATERKCRGTRSMINTQVVEASSPNHPYGIRDCGGTSLAAAGNVASHAIGARMTRLPLSLSRALRRWSMATSRPSLRMSG